MKRNVIEAPKQDDLQGQEEKFEPYARPWPRYWAKYFDILLFSTISSFMVGIFAPSLFEQGGIFEGEYLLGLVLLPVALLLEAICYCSTGTTPGKWLVGIKMVTLRGERVPLSVAVARNLHLWLSGLALGIPLVALVTLSRNYSDVRGGKLTAWDEKWFTRVRGDSPGWRTWLIAMLTVTLFVGLTVVGRMPQAEVDALFRPDIPSTAAPEDFQRYLAEVRKELPQKINENTVWDDIKFENENRLSYYYSLPKAEVNIEDFEINSEMMRGDMGDRALEYYCENKDGMGLVETGTSVRYVYYDKNGRLAAVVQFYPSDCPIQ